MGRDGTERGKAGRNTVGIPTGLHLCLPCLRLTGGILTMPYLTVVPAYGRDYKSAKAVKDDWEAGKDFRIQDISSRYDGSYINKAGKPAGVILSIRYNRLPG
jgi:hypothetical protein